MTHPDPPAQAGNVQGDTLIRDEKKLERIAAVRRAIKAAYYDQVDLDCDALAIAAIEALEKWEASDLLAALKNVVADVLEYERLNNLYPNPGRKYCWDSVARATAAIARAENRS